MFDIGFWELIVISVVALVVLGPERLPHAVRTVTYWIGIFRDTALKMKTELINEGNIQEITSNITDLTNDVRTSGVEILAEMRQESNFIIEGTSSFHKNEKDNAFTTCEEVNGFCVKDGVDETYEFRQEITKGEGG